MTYHWIKQNFVHKIGEDSVISIQVAKWCNEYNVLDFYVVQMEDDYIEVVGKVEVDDTPN